MEVDVSSNEHGVLKISFDFIDDVFGGTPKEDGTCLGIMTSSQEGKVSGMLVRYVNAVASREGTHRQFSRCGKDRSLLLHRIHEYLLRD